MKVKTSAEPVALLPATVVTVTSTGPGEAAGDVATIRVFGIDAVARGRVPAEVNRRDVGEVAARDRHRGAAGGRPRRGADRGDGRARLNVSVEGDLSFGITAVAAWVEPSGRGGSQSEELRRPAVMEATPIDVRGIAGVDPDRVPGLDRQVRGEGLERGAGGRLGAACTDTGEAVPPGVPQHAQPERAASGEEHPPANDRAADRRGDVRSGLGQRRIRGRADVYSGRGEGRVSGLPTVTVAARAFAPNERSAMAAIGTAERRRRKRRGASGCASHRREP